MPESRIPLRVNAIGVSVHSCSLQVPLGGAWFSLTVGVLLILANITFCADRSFAASQYTVRGEYLLEVFQLGPMAPPAWSNAGTFRVDVKDSNWRLSCQPAPFQRAQGPPLIVKDLLASFDGETIYQLYSTETPSETPRPADLPPEVNGTNPRLAELVNGPVPQRIDQRLQHLWLGLASGSYFRNTQPGYHQRLALPPEDVNVHDNSRRVFATWLPQPLQPGIPGQVAYLDTERDGARTASEQGYTNVLSNQRQCIGLCPHGNEAWSMMASNASHGTLLQVGVL